MQYPIVQVKTDDGLWLYGLFLPASQSKTVFMNVHGTASNFYEEYFIEVLAREIVPKGIAMLSTNNRGAGVYDAWQKSGAAVEKFEDGVSDIDAWVSFAVGKGYERIILSGHSLGAEKVVYYMRHGRHADKVVAVVLLGPSDSFGSHRMHEGGENTRVGPKVAELLKEAQILIEQGKGDTFLPRDAYGSHAGIMPKSATSFVDFLGPNSKLNEGLPFATGKLEAYSKITVPILVAIGDQAEYTALTVKDALALLKKENPKAEAVQIENCDHDFQGKEDKLAGTVKDFLERHDLKEV